MSKFGSHRICERCWFDLNPNRMPVQLRDPEIGSCCFCTKPVVSGIFVRAANDGLSCKGNHDKKEECHASDGTDTCTCCCCTGNCDEPAEDNTEP